MLTYLNFIFKLQDAHLHILFYLGSISNARNAHIKLYNSLQSAFTWIE